MTRAENSAASPGDIAAALLLLKKMGIDPADLLQDPAAAPAIPTFADYIPRVSRAVSDGTRRVYTTYWNRVTDAWGTRLITEPSRWRSASSPRTPRRTSPRAATPAADAAQPST